MCAYIKEGKWLMILTLLTLHTLLHKLFNNMITFLAPVVRHYLFGVLIGNTCEFVLSLVAFPWLLFYGNA